jgi:signal transduction protein with GAF and PtsI domain
LFYEADKEGVILDTEKIIGMLMSNIAKANQFVENLSTGNYKIEWEGSIENDENNKHTLAGTLIKLKENLLQVEKDRQQRRWFNEGINKLSDIVRKHQDDKEQFYDQVLMFSLKYIGANQGGLFVFNSESKSLFLKASYAYDRKKFLEKEIKIGEGMIGQVYLEKEPVHLRNIPDEYTYIQSGLGEAIPASIYILPLINNEEVIGIMELASFTHFEEKEISFLEKLAEIIASSLYVQLNNETTKALLERSQEQSEELRAQEEEMRQNTEELQATQEEMGRHKISLEKEIKMLKEELEQKNSVVS